MKFLFCFNPIELDYDTNCSLGVTTKLAYFILFFISVCEERDTVQLWWNKANWEGKMLDEFIENEYIYVQVSRCTDMEEKKICLYF